MGYSPLVTGHVAMASFFLPLSPSSTTSRQYGAGWTATQRGLEPLFLRHFCGSPFLIAGRPEMLGGSVGSSHTLSVHPKVW